MKNMTYFITLVLFVLITTTADVKAAATKTIEDYYNTKVVMIYINKTWVVALQNNNDETDKGNDISI